MIKKNKKIKKPLVSIITPSYNQGVFIRETIDSIRAQDYPNIEHIILDGGSTDSTLEVLKSYGKDLRWTSKKDKGQSDAINTGFAMASGEIFAWLNSDDTYLPSAISKVVDFFNSHPDISVVYGDANYINTTGKIIGKYPTEAFDYKRLAVVDFICQPSTFFRASAWKKSEALDLSLVYTMDYDLWIRLAKVESFSHLKQVLSTYRLHGEAKTTAEKYAFLMHSEILKVVIKHYRWAPANRVYAYCNHLIKNKKVSRSSNLITITLSILLSLTKYITLNKGRVRLADLKMFTPGNIKKIIHSRFGGATEYDI